MLSLLTFSFKTSQLPLPVTLLEMTRRRLSVTLAQIMLDVHFPPPNTPRNLIRELNCGKAINIRGTLTKGCQMDNLQDRKQKKYILSASIIAISDEISPPPPRVFQPFAGSL